MSADAVRQLPALLRFSDEMRSRSAALKKFLFQNLYRHPQVVHTTGQARQAIRELFEAYRESPEEMQAGFVARAQAVHGNADEEHAVLRVVADYIAGMTDRFAWREHERLTGQRLLA